MTDARGPELSEVSAILRAGVDEGVAPAMAAAVIARGDLVHESWHGDAQVIPERRPLAPGAIFDVASVTKVVATTTLAALLVDDGVLGLDEPVAAYLPGFGAAGKGSVTLRHLLTHTSGLAGWQPFYEPAVADPVAGAAFLPPATRPRDLAAAFARGREIVKGAVLGAALEIPTQTCAVYSDLGFLALGWVIEAVAGPLAKLFDERVARPLGLRDTFFLAESDADEAARRRAGRAFVATEACEHRHEVNCGAVDDDNAWAIGGVAGHAGLFSTPVETARVGQSWLDALHGRAAIVTPQTAALFASRDPTPDGTRAVGWDTPSATGSSLGTLLGRGRRGALGHLGFTGTSLWLDIDHEVVCALFTNRVHPARQNEAIKAFRPRFHDAVAAALGL